MRFINRKNIVSLYIINIIVLSFCFSSCTNWEYNKVVHGIEFSKIKYETQNNDTLSIIGYLSSDKIIEEYPCAEDYVHFTKDWHINFFRLSDNAIINNYDYAKGTWIKFDDKHNVICVFPGNTFVQGYSCKGGGGAKGISTLFYKSGRLNCFYSEDDVLIDRIPCRGGVLNNIGLYENGNLKECTLARDKEINGTLCKKLTRVSFDVNGKISSTY